MTSKRAISDTELNWPARKLKRNGSRTKTKPGYTVVGYCPECGECVGVPSGPKASKAMCKKKHVFFVKGSV